MKQNKPLALFIILIVFIFWVFGTKTSCPCDNDKNDKKNKCFRFEIWGVQVNHFIFFLILGFFFSEYFFTIQLAGIIWELFEYYIHIEPKMLDHIGGCLDKLNTNVEWEKKFIVSKDIEKNYNPIDKLAGIKNSTIHGWHHSIAEIILNIISFSFGSYLNYSKVSYKYLVAFISIVILFTPKL